MDPDLWLMSGERDAGVVRRRLERLSPADCEAQSMVIAQALRDRFRAEHGSRELAAAGS